MVLYIIGLSMSLTKTITVVCCKQISDTENINRHFEVFVITHINEVAFSAIMMYKYQVQVYYTTIWN